MVASVISIVYLALPLKLTWDANMCWDSWIMKGEGELILWEERPPFSWLFSLGKKEHKCILMEEKASGFTGNCPGWNKGVPSLRNCRLGEPEKSEVWRWQVLRDDECCISNTVGQTPSFISLVCSFEKWISAGHISYNVLNMGLSFVGPWLWLLLWRADLLHSISSLFWVIVDIGSTLEELGSAMSLSCRSRSESFPILSSPVEI